MIYWLGDLPPHHVWSQTRDDQLLVYQKLLALFEKHFPDALIFPALGIRIPYYTESFVL